MDYNAGWKYYLNNYAAKIASGDGLIFSVAPTGTAGNAITWVDALKITSTGAATFSSTLGINGVADNIKSGTYTPTVTAISNVSSTSTGLCQYMRVGNTVTVSGVVVIAATSILISSYPTTISITLPITSSFSSIVQAAGTCNSYGYNQTITGVIYANSSSSVVRMDIDPVGKTTGGVQYFFTYTYQIL